jgi:hypothetical protein
MFLSEWHEFLSALCLAGKEIKLDLSHPEGFVQYHWVKVSLTQQ